MICAIPEEIEHRLYNHTIHVILPPFNPSPKISEACRMTVGGRVGALWIGGLEPYMDEAFLQVDQLLYLIYDIHILTILHIRCISSFQNAMNMMGESGVVSIKVRSSLSMGLIGNTHGQSIRAYWPPILCTGRQLLPSLSMRHGWPIEAYWPPM